MSSSPSCWPSSRRSRRTPASRSRSLAHEQLAERTRAVLCQTEVVRQGLAVADERTLALVQRELRAIKTERAALSRLPR